MAEASKNPGGPACVPAATRPPAASERPKLLYHADGGIRIPVQYHDPIELASDEVEALIRTWLRFHHKSCSPTTGGTWMFYAVAVDV